MSSKSADIDQYLRFETGESALTGKLRVEPGAAENISRDALIAYLRGREVYASCILEEELDALIEELMSDLTRPHERVVARGDPPENGLNAKIELTENIAKIHERIKKRKEAFLLAQEENKFESNDGSAIDFYNESAFVTVRSGEEVARFIEHTLGNDGMDVYGRPVAAKPGKPIANPCDATCDIDTDGFIVALQDGLLVIHPERVSIQSTLNVGGYVDFSTGNIDFPGDVVIEKGVRDRFKVNADFMLEVHKLVEAAHLNSSLGIKLHQGMAGRETGTITTQGDLESGYLDAVEADVRGNCVIEKELTNCTVRVAGKLLAKNASVRGGLIEVAMGAEVGNVGSEQGVPTDIVLGAHPVLQQKLTQINELLPKINSEYKSSKRKFNSLKNAAGKANPELQTELFYLESSLRNLEVKQKQLEDARERIVALFALHTKCQLTVHGSLFAKTKVWLPGECATFDRDYKGEFTIRLNNAGKPIMDWGTKIEPLGKVAKLRADNRVPARKPVNEGDQGGMGPQSQAA